MLQAHNRWLTEYRYEVLGKQAAEAEARIRGIDEKRIRAVLWYPIAGVSREGEPCACKAMVWLNGICLGCGAKKRGTVESLGNGVSLVYD